ncbi:MAG: ribonuclease P protein component [Anaerolineae bacterium]|nr:ribonuclease P protein component [Anaerolineae bacterium]
MWLKSMRLRRSQEFRRVWSEGRSWAHHLFILWAVPNTLSHTRVGLTASRKVGNAVARNRARRLLREAMRHKYAHIEPGWDIVLVARIPLLEVKESQVELALEKLLQRAHLWVTSEENRR